LRLQAQAGTTYRWAVTGIAGASGSLVLNWALNTAAQADLGIAASGPGTVAAGATAVVNLTASNTGPQAATAVVVRLSLPPGLDAGNLPAACTAGPALISCSQDEISAGASVSLALPLINTGLGGPASLSASVASAVPDPVSANDAAQLVLTPEGAGGPADSADIPTLPTWAVLALGLSLLWRWRSPRTTA